MEFRTSGSQVTRVSDTSPDSLFVCLFVCYCFFLFLVCLFGLCVCVCVFVFVFSAKVKPLLCNNDNNAGVFHDLVEKYN
jgi:hypothetical protein